MSLSPDIRTEKWVENFYRFGIVSKGIVYCILGVLALMAAMGIGKEGGGKQGAIDLIMEQSFGKILLVVLTIGLIGYVVWRFIQAINDTEGAGTDTKGLFKRIGFAISGLIYASLAFYSATLLTKGKGSGNGGGDSEKFIVGKILELSYGQFVVGVIGLIIIGKGISQIYKAYTGKFVEKIHEQKMGSASNSVFKKAGKIGYSSRGIVLSIIGFFLILAAVHSNPGEVKNTEGAFSIINSSFGPIVLGLVALGLIGYGVFMFFMAKYREIGT